jgi:hypothetical protein
MYATYTEEILYYIPEAALEGGVRGVRPPKIRKAYVMQR